MQANKICEICGTLGHSKYYCRSRKRKPIKKMSIKEMQYQAWKESTARPLVIDRDGIFCQCPGGCTNLGTDLEHELGKGSHPELKRDINNLRLFCRYPCHDNKTNNRECIHA